MVVFNSRNNILATMTNGAKPLLCVLVILVLGAWTSATANQTSGGNPYGAIVDRNVFGLKPPAPPPDPEANKPPPRKIILTGIYKMGATARALMKVAEPPKPPEPAKEIPLILSEGQRDADVEVLAIDTITSVVKVSNAGTVMTLDFTNNGAAKLASAGAPAAMPRPGGMGVPPGPGPFVPPNPANPPPTTRQMRLGGGAAVSPTGYNPTPAASGVPVQPTTYTAVPSAPAYNTAYNASQGLAIGSPAAGNLTVPGVASAPTTGQGFKNWPPEQNLSPEQTAIAQQAYMQKYANEIAAGKMPPIPGFTPIGQQQTSPNSTTPVNTGPPLPAGAARRYVPQ
jgi:hypothetical protein